MKKVPQHIDDLLLNYLDGTLTPKAAADLEKQLITDEDLKFRLETLRILDSSLSRTKLESPSKNFTHRVMEGLHKAPAKNALSIKNGILLILGVITVITILALLVATGSFDSTGVLQPNQIGIKDNYFNLNIPSISINGKLIINTIIFLNLAIALIVLDRTVLRPLFEKRVLDVRN